MSTFTHHWRIVFVTLLLGFIASATSNSVLAANPPVANASASTNLSGIVPSTVNFDGSLSQCASSCNFTWVFGDGSPSFGSGLAGTTHTYTVVGNYTATLTVTDSQSGLTATTTLTVSVQQGETLTSYVNTCEQQLGFADADVAAIAGKLNCTKGVLFAPNALGPQVNDYMGYARIKDQVDLAFACRWLQNGTGVNENTVPPFVAAASIELIIHNRQNGNTCFFKAADQTVQGPDETLTDVAPVAIVSPTVAARAALNTPAANFWDPPIVIDREIQCVGCHIAGPYISTPRIAPFLAQFGLLNNGHDTFGLTLNAQNNLVGNYHIVGSTFAHFNNLAASENVVTTSTCANGCHSIGYNSTVGDVTLGRGNTLIPAIANVIDSAGVVSPDISVTTSGVMPPFNDDYSDYRWINLDTPGDGVESESFAAAKSASTTLVPKLLSQCAAPVTMEAHVVGSTNTFMVAQASNFGLLPDRLSVFNLKDGLVCLNSDQEPGNQCQDYSTSYECTDANGKKTWTGWYNTDSPSTDSSGDNEARSKDGNLCPSGSTATGIQAETTLNINGWTYSSYGPNDRLAQISPYGLTCNNADQPDGQCSNYVVRYENCTTAPQIYSAKLSSAYSGKLLTASSSSNNALTKGEAPIYGLTQGWSVEPVLNTEYVRLRNIGTNTYLNVTSQAESATVVTSTSSTSTSEEWIVEPSTYGVRLKNLWSGKYLTMATTGTISAIYSQSRNTSLANQRWGI